MTIHLLPSLHHSVGYQRNSWFTVFIIIMYRCGQFGEELRATTVMKYVRLDEPLHGQIRNRSMLYVIYQIQSVDRGLSNKRWLFHELWKKNSNLTGFRIIHDRYFFSYT